MLLSQFFLPTLKESPADAEVVSHKLMLRAGMIRRLASGIYTWCPLGYRVLKKVEQVVREEMNATGAQEILMPSMQPKELWDESERWEAYGAELLRITDRHEREFCYGPTHEEVVTELVRHELRSYKQLPLSLYQIQTKFRDEIRPRFGIMRGREFLMKDAYSFHISAESMQATYDEMFAAYNKIFTRLGLQYRPVQADSGEIGGDCSHEFHVLADSGEDTLLYSDDSDFAANVEKYPDAKVGDDSPCGRGKLLTAKGIEVGHIFQLGDKYARSMNATVLDENGKNVTLLMGCYGIGVSRVVAAAIEQNHDDKGIIWPEAMAPFQIALLPLSMHKSYRVREAAEKLYADLQAAGYSVLFDDRKERAGVMFATSELIGLPHRVVVTERGLDNGTLEYKGRTDAESQDIKLDDVMGFLQQTVMA